MKTKITNAKKTITLESERDLQKIRISVTVERNEHSRVVDVKVPVSATSSNVFYAQTQELQKALGARQLQHSANFEAARLASAIMKRGVKLYPNHELSKIKVS